MKNIIFTCFLFAVFLCGALAMTRAQLKKTLGVMKKQCMPKHGVNDAKVGKIEQGEFIEDHNVMCYIHCVYKNIQVVNKKDRLDKDMVKKQIDILYPEELKEAVKATVEQCIHIQEKYADSCEGTFHAVKCLYDKGPENFIFP